MLLTYDPEPKFSIICKILIGSANFQKKIAKNDPEQQFADCTRKCSEQTVFKESSSDVLQYIDPEELFVFARFF